MPPPGWRVYALPSVPLTVTWVALVAFTVRVEEPPALMEVGLAMMLTVGAAAGLLESLDSLLLEPPPHPVSSASMAISAAGSSARERDRKLPTLIIMRVTYICATSNDEVSVFTGSKWGRLSSPASASLPSREEGAGSHSRLRPSKACLYLLSSNQRR